jgi:hypothetical protein
MILFKKSWMIVTCWSISTTNREWIEEDAWSFFCLILFQFIDFHALLERIMFVSLFRIRLIKIEMWFDDWLRFNLMLQCITRFARNSIMKIRSIVLCTLRALHVTCFLDDNVDRENKKEIQIFDQIQSLIRCRVLSELSEFVSQRMMKIKVAQ